MQFTALGRFRGHAPPEIIFELLDSETATISLLYHYKTQFLLIPQGNANFLLQGGRGQLNFPDMKRDSHKLSIIIKANCKTQYKETVAGVGDGRTTTIILFRGRIVALSRNCSPSPVGEKIACRWGKN
jgi:hypothetical protein